MEHKQIVLCNGKDLGGIMISEYTYSSKVWLFPYERVMPGEEVIVYGAGYIGSRLVQQIEKNNYCKIRYLTDKNWSRLGALKWGG